MINSNLLKETLITILKSHGFSKKSNNWYLHNAEVILVVNLQKSQYGEQYYLNCGVSLKSFGCGDFPKENLCDIRFRLTSVVPKSDREKCELAFDLENNSLSEDARKLLITDFFERFGLTLLLDCNSISSAANALKSGRLPEWTASKKAADFLLSYCTTK